MTDQEKIEAQEQRSERLRAAVASQFKAITDWLKKTVNRAVKIIKALFVRAFNKISDKKEIARHKNNKHNRGAWITIQDTRKKSQVMNNRPPSYVRKIIR